ncbi:MAG: DUF465 domain-containing protein [Nitrospirae bacterium]|nr:DUF465 domain-containing protein [Nitrospirota bacterium]
MAELKEQELTDYFLREHEEYKKLYQEHRRLEESLKALDERRFLTVAEEFERKRVQKQKLLKKDRMAEIIREYRQGQLVR